MQNIICLIGLIAIAALLIWSGFRAWRIRNRFLKWSGLGLAALLGRRGVVRQRPHDRGDSQAAYPQRSGSGPQG